MRPGDETPVYVFGLDNVVAGIVRITRRIHPTRGVRYQRFSGLPNEWHYEGTEKYFDTHEEAWQYVHDSYASEEIVHWSIDL